MSHVDDAEVARVVALARRVVAGELAARDGAEEICAPVDRSGGPTALTAAQWDLYLPFYGWLSEWQSSESSRGRSGEEMPAELIASYEEELRKAARELIATHPDANG